MKPAEIQFLLNKLCSELGFCLSPSEQKQLVTEPPGEPLDFVIAVFAAEGMNHELVDRKLFRQVNAMVKALTVPAANRRLAQQPIAQSILIPQKGDTMKLSFAVVTTLLFLSIPFSASASSTQKSNKAVVEAFYDLAFDKHNPTEAMKQYVGEKYIQHNPFAGDGKQPFIDFFKDYYAKNPDASVDIKRLIVEGELVVVHAHSKQNKTDRGSAVIDIFRLEKGKIVEHWDVMQPIPEKPANGNSMF